MACIRRVFSLIRLLVRNVNNRSFTHWSWSGTKYRAGCSNDKTNALQCERRETVTHTHTDNTKNNGKPISEAYNNTLIILHHFWLFWSISMSPRRIITIIIMHKNNSVFVHFPLMSCARACPLFVFMFPLSCLSVSHIWFELNKNFVYFVCCV